VNRIVVGASNTQRAGKLLIAAQCSIKFLVCNRHRCLRFLIAGALFLFMTNLAAAQNSAVRPRITTRVDDGMLTVLPGNMHPLARAQYDQGKVDPSLKVGRITMMFQPTATQQADLDALLAAQQNPTSASFHQWLTPGQYGARFGIAQADLDMVTAWLLAHGFVVVEAPASRNFIVFDGTAAQVESAFHTEIHNYVVSGRKFYANSAEPSVPSALAVVVPGFRGLNNYQLRPRSTRKSPMSSAPQPNFTSNTSGFHFLSPGDFAQIYDLNPQYSASTAIDGTGQNIVIVGQSNIVLADISAFRTASGLPARAPLVTLVPTSTDPGVLSSTGDEQESSGDLEWAGAVAKNATIRLVYSGNGVFDALQYAISQNYAPVISMSYGACEATFATSDINSIVALAQQANSQGITIVSSAGDGGATDCDGDLSNYPAQLGLSVDVPASLPYVTGVGGTEFNEGNGHYWQPASGSDVVTSALSYIPEVVWNDSSLANGLLAGGGGASQVFGKPSWQTGTGVPADGARDVPDISLGASPNHDGYLVCNQFLPTGSTTFTSSCLNGGFRYSDNSLQVYGGTSFGAPAFAGILALINQKTGSTGQGNVNYILYSLAASSPTAFHDITTGDNKSPCVQGTENCPNGGSIGFSAGTGYDQATGLGTIDATNLVNAWSSITTSSGSTPTLSSISPTSISSGAASFTLTATGSNFATNAQILWNGSTSGVTMQPGGTSTSIKATISSTLVAYGTIASVTVTDDAAKAGESSASRTFTVNGTPPANDNIANAIAVTSSSFTSTVDNSAATTESTDPTPPCAVHSTNPRTKTVWWSLTSGVSGTVTATTIGSVYDTTLSVWTGTPGSLTNVACNDDVSGGQFTQSMLTFSATAGTKYYFMVAPFGPPDTGADLLGGKTVLNVSNANPASTQAPTITSAASATFTVGTAGSFTVTTTGSPTPTLSESGALPSGVTFNSGTGVLSGTPAAGSAGSYSAVRFTAHNGVGADATQNFTLTVNPAILSGSPASQTVAAGSSATYTITNTGNVLYALTCSGLPTGAACIPVSVGANSTASLVITTTSRTLAVTPAMPNRPLHLNLWGEALSALSISILILLALRRRRVQALIPVSALALLLVLLVAGCGGSGGSSGGGGGVNPNGTPAGTYPITVTGTSGSTTQVTTIILVVT
jgi:hypothetical protein